ncbi:MAG TPA: alginate export family protein [Bryobacteraceae bacterium]|nr:alginate export family protein [Bryobacteraceae bacterium]
MTSSDISFGLLRWLGIGSGLAAAFFAHTAIAQDDVTTHSAASSYAGGYITGPASNPLSFLNGPAYRTYGSTAPYDVPDSAPASLLNRQLPRWITFGWEERFRYEGYHNGSFKTHNNDSYILLRSRLQMTIQPTPWFKISAQLQDSRPFMQKPPWGPPNLNAWDLKLAYAEFGDPEKQWISVRVGRQLLNYNNTIIADSEWRNQARSYDGVVTNLHYDRYRLGLFATSVVVPLPEGISHHLEGNNIYGAYGGIDHIIPNSVLEPFVLWRIQQSVAIETTAKTKTGKQDEWAFGLRFKGIAVKNLDYSAEWVAERGSDGSNRINAWGVTFGAGYRFDPLWGKPRIFWQADYATGDKNPVDGMHGTFDTMYPTAHDRFGITDQFGWQNIIAERAGLTIEPHRRWSITGQYLDFWLASATDALYNTSGGVIVRDTTGNSGTHIGQEVDAYTWYELNRHVNVGVGVGHLMGGEFLEKTTKAPSYNYPYFAINFKDNGKSR